MNLTLVSELEFLFGLSKTSTLVSGDAITEIQEAARRRGLKIRVIGPREFSLPAIFEAARNDLLTRRDDPIAGGFWTGLRLALRIPDSVQVLVFTQIDHLDDRHAAALESLAKGDMNRPEHGARFEHIWATSTTLAPFNSRLEKAFALFATAAPT